MATPSDIGARLRALREAASLTQSALAQRLGGRHGSRISNIENGQRDVDLELIERWAGACGVEARVEFAPPRADPELAAELDALRDAPPTGEARAALLAHIRAWRALADAKEGR
jgi:transcriptional regulator with XRE-family HTH domain